MTNEELDRRLTAIENIFRQHKHSGIDSRPVEIPFIPDFPVDVTITAKSNLSVNSGDADTDTVINNTRTRLDDLISELTSTQVIR
jgi:hypothetical protein